MANVTNSNFIMKGVKIMHEYRKYRCCMCPNGDNVQNTQCPTGHFKKEITTCRFVKTYIDKRGWKYKVMPGLGENNFKARYQKPGKTGWKCMKNLNWKKSFDEAQSDLNIMAKKKGWNEILE